MPYDEEQHDDGFDDTPGRVQIDLWKRLFGYALGYRRELAFLIVAAIATAAAEVCYSLFTKWVVDDVQRNGMDASFGLWGSLYVLCNLVVALAIGGFRVDRRTGELLRQPRHPLRRLPEPPAAVVRVFRQASGGLADGAPHRGLRPADRHPLLGLCRPDLGMHDHDRPGGRPCW